jgi:cell wall-associated NlpC family hydrolase
MMILVGIANADAVTPMQHELDRKNMTNELSSVNVWTPELPLIRPAKETVAEDNNDTPDYISDMLAFANKYKGLRYRHGGKTPQGFDCSGFTSYVFKQFGLKLASSSAAQYTQGEKVSHGDLQPGDLVFFSGRAASKSRVGHVGLVTDVNSDGTFKFIHSSNMSGIVISKSTEPYYSRRYIGARRVR